MIQNLWSLIEPLLLQVKSPSQYIGGEFNSIVKNHSSVSVKVALCFPDTYAIGMSHWGLQVLYGAINQREDALSERVFAPQVDMENLLRQESIPLFTLETHTPIKNFDILAFSLQYELVYTNVLNILDLSGIPLQRTARSDNDPLVIAGGPCVFNPEPLSDFIDIFVIGDGEQKIGEIISVLKEIKQSNIKHSREDIIKHLIKNISSLYAPSLYQVNYNSDDTIKEILPLFDWIPTRVAKATVEDLDNVFYPTSPIVPLGNAIHNRINLEIMRGCPHSCRFCVSGVIKSPLRIRSVKKLITLSEEIYRNTGYEEISLLSLSSGDYPDLDELLVRLNSRFKARRVGLSLPSLRVDEKLMKLPEILNTVRKASFTMSPETGTETIREVINKNIKDEDLYSAIRAAYRNGWRLVKLYFMIGLPSETMDDVKAIAEIVHKASAIGLDVFGRYGKINVTISPFVPKPHTAFQWSRMDNLATLLEKQLLLKKLLSQKNIRVKFHQPQRSFIESIFSRGDRRLGKLLLIAYRNGCKFDAWDEYFDFTKWQKTLEDASREINSEFYALRERKHSEILPWDMIDAGFSREQLQPEPILSR
jgi:radical SAM family uncharacterized protein